MNGIIGQIVDFSHFLFISRLMSYPKYQKILFKLSTKCFFIKWNNFEGWDFRKSWFLKNHHFKSHPKTHVHINKETLENYHATNVKNKRDLQRFGFAKVAFFTKVELLTTFAISASTASNTASAPLLLLALLPSISGW